VGAACCWAVQIELRSVLSPTISFRVSTATATRPRADLFSESQLAGIFLLAAKRRRNSAQGERSGTLGHELPMDASPGGAKEHDWNSQLLERFFLRPSGLVHTEPVSQGSALRLHPGLNSYAASRLDYSEAFPRLLKRADAKEVRPYTALLAERRWSCLQSHGACQNPKRFRYRSPWH
jgi:hypothetical protein